MDEQPPRGLRRTVVIGPNTKPLQEFLTAQRTVGAGGDARLTVIGWEPGRTAWLHKASVAFVVIAMTVGIGSLVFVRSLVVTIAIDLLAVGTFFVIWQVISRRRGSASVWEPFGIVLTDRRLLVARESPTGPTLLRDEPAGAVSWAAIDESERFLLLSGNPRLTLGGDLGPIAVVETPEVSRDMLRALAGDAGLRLAPAPR